MAHEPADVARMPAEASQEPAGAYSRATVCADVAETKAAVAVPKPRPALSYRARDLTDGQVNAAVDRAKAALASALG